MGVIERKTVQDTKLQQSFGRNSSEISSRKYEFSRNDQEVQYLSTVTKAEIDEVFQTGILNNNRILISAVEGVLPETQKVKKVDFAEENVPPGDAFDDCIVITDIAEFRNAQSFITG